jgi:hypothetical protein
MDAVDSPLDVLMPIPNLLVLDWAYGCTDRSFKSTWAYLWVKCGTLWRPPVAWDSIGVCPREFWDMLLSCAVEYCVELLLAGWWLLWRFMLWTSSHGEPAGEPCTRTPLSLLRGVDRGMSCKDAMLRGDCRRPAWALYVSVFCLVQAWA